MTSAASTNRFVFIVCQEPFTQRFHELLFGARRRGRAIVGTRFARRASGQTHLGELLDHLFRRQVTRQAFKSHVTGSGSARMKFTSFEAP